MVTPLLVMLGLFAAGTPIAIALGIAPLVTLHEKGIPLIAIPQVVFESLDSFALMALPLYVLAGRLMEMGGIARRLVRFAVAVVGWLPGGLGAAVVVTAMLFATISGSSAATAAAIGSVLIPEMQRQNYPREYAAAVTASSGELGVIIPPSIPMVIYAVLTSSSISDLFIAGFLPGVLIGLSLIATNCIIAARRGYGTRQVIAPRAWLCQLAGATREASLALVMPVIILGGIYGGFFTATEAAAVAVVYALGIGLFVYREIGLADLPGLFADAAITASTVMIIVGFAAMFAFALSLLQAPQLVSAMLASVTSSPAMFLLLVNLFLLVVGMFMETFAAIIILAPVLAPVAASFGINPTHFGLVMIVNLAVGMVTPPVGVNLFVACGIARITMEQLMRPLLVFLGVLFVDLAIITYVPALSLALLRLR